MSSEPPTESRSLLRGPVCVALGVIVAAVCGCASDVALDAARGDALIDNRPADVWPSDVGTDAATGDASIDVGAGDVGVMDTLATDGGDLDVAAVDTGPTDSGATDSVAIDSGAIDGGATDSGTPDTGTADSGRVDAGVVDVVPTGAITGGPCASLVPGSTAWRVRWTNAAGRATVSYEINGLPDRTRWRVTANAMMIGFVPRYRDMFLGPGGLELGSGTFIDVEMSTVGLRSISRAVIAVYGRSFSTTTSGSFSWQTFSGMAATPANTVSNVAPYQWYTGDATSAFRTGDAGVLLRIRSGPSSGVLIVNRLELCMQAD